MLKFMVVLYRRPDMTHSQFRRYMEEVHGPLALKLPGLRKYTQNYICNDPKRLPGWDCIVELFFDNWEGMEAAWASPQGKAATDDLPLFADLTRSTWSAMEEVKVLT
ncbi:MAG TPA: EthD family reductase [Candidatus Sulfotelmatobacter sp.]|nr:EthD family reductase [Candidatus Sulfotelmatobacter sp.]